jgi:hypothetical protein
MLLGKLSFRQTAPRGSNDLLFDQFFAASTAKVGAVRAIQESLAEVYRSRRDTLFVCDCCTIPTCVDPEELAGEVDEGLDAALPAMGVGMEDRGLLRDYVARRTASIRDPRGMAVRAEYTRRIRQEARHAAPCHAARVGGNAPIAVPVDRDIRRRVFCSLEGYQFRLRVAIRNSPNTYLHRGDLSVAAAEEARTERARSVFSRRDIGRIDKLRVPRAYTLPKAR